VADGPGGFTNAFYKKIYNNLVVNLDVDGSGAIVAARDPNTQSGSYFYSWMRDTSVFIKTFIEINENGYSKFKYVLT
jgi:hypothetical protein